MFVFVCLFLPVAVMCGVHAEVLYMYRFEVALPLCCGGEGLLQLSPTQYCGSVILMRDCFATQTARVVRSATCHLLCVTLVFRLHVGVKDGLGLQWKINGGGSPLGGEHTEMHGCRCRRYKYSAAAERHSWLRPQLPACLAWEWHTDKRWSRAKYFHSFMHLWKGACQLRRLQPRLIVSLSVWEVLFLGDPPEPQTITGLTASPTMHFRRREDTLAAFQRVRFFVTLVHRFFFSLVCEWLR